MTGSQLMQCIHIHFIGIGGISMSGLAEILNSKGFAVSGSDAKESALTKRLRWDGVEVFIGHSADNIRPTVDLVVYTAAIHKDNEELVAARHLGKRTIDRAELLGALIERYTYPICISGTHGKTTTTSMLSEIFIKAKKEPTITIGGILPSIGSNILIGESEYFVAEACEYFDSFLKFFPYAGLILNVDYDHLDFFESMEHVVASYKQFAHNIKPDGFLVINNEIKQLEEITQDLACRVVTYGPRGDYYAENIIYGDDGCGTFDCMYKGKLLMRIALAVTGAHNISNALAAIATGCEFEIPTDIVAEALASFEGTNRRFQIKGKFNDVTVVDDYAHHPTEIDATLKAARQTKHNQIWCVFQPHTYTRTKKLLNEIARSFAYADHVLVLDIYAAREKDTDEINSQILTERIRAQGTAATYLPSFDAAVEFIRANCAPGDMLITMGAGDVNLLGEQLLA